ncbi:MAG TPA: hypothetical protein IAC41_11395 [Candidatus Merdenecus merdavium]|nr:hypothetical protein [Candidatus Merdenecus merdavium]
MNVAAVSVDDILNQAQANGKVIVANGKNMDQVKEKLSQLGIDLDTINWDCPTIPKPETPETETPETETPETETPETEVPETPKPETPETPEQEVPETESPETEEESNADRTFAEQVVKLVNEERSKRGLSPLTLDRNIEAAALVRAKETETSFSHTRPNGSSFSTALKEQGITYMGAGENIAYGQRTPEEVMEGWMNSDGHRANILNASFTKIGVGYYQNSNGTNYWTQLFTY